VKRAAAWIVVLPWAAWAAVRLLGLERGFPLVPIMAFTPLAAVLAAIAAMIAGVLRRPFPAMVAVASTGALVAVVLPRVLSDPAPDRGAVAGPRLRVMTVNVRFGLADPAAVVSLARRERVDVLAVEELTPELEAGLRRLGLDRLYHFRAGRPGSGATGTMLFSRRPLARLQAPRTTNVAAAGILTVPGVQPVELYAVHMSAPWDIARTARWGRDLRALPPAATPGALRIIAGDLNSTLDHAELRRVLATGYQDAADEAGAGLDPTWPSDRRIPPGVTIDHVLADARCGVGEVRTFDVPGTDHRALLAELVLPRR
jgi:endonuclease/exonuclease/phosphatase (EEP) superfamily protein YafD